MDDLETARDVRRMRKLRDGQREKRVSILYADGLTKVAIGKRIGASEFYVRCVVKRLGLKRT